MQFDFYQLIKVKWLRSGILVLALGGLLFATALAWHRFTALPSGSEATMQATHYEESALDQAGPSVVSLLAIKRDGLDTQIGLMGCGVIVDERGYVLTSVAMSPNIESLHVVDADNTEYEVEVVTRDRTGRLTLLKISQADPQVAPVLQAATWADPKHIKRGETLFALGGQMTPNGWELTTETGRVLDTRQTLILQGTTHRNLLQTDLDLTMQNDGGPLINTQGQVVGLAVPGVRAPHCPELSYAIQAQDVQNFMTRLPIPHWGQDSSAQVCRWLDIETLPLTPAQQTSQPNERRHGEIVHFVKRNSPAYLAGLRRGDVITRINDQVITDPASFDAMAPSLCRMDSIQLTVLQQGQEQIVDLNWSNPVYVQPDGTGLPEVILVVLVFVLIYFLVYKDIFNRVVLFVFGALILMILGQRLGFYNQDQIVKALVGKIDVLCFIVGMQLVVGVLDEAGALSNLAKRITVATRGNTWRILWLFCVMTYGLSLFVNNLTTIMLIAPMVLILSKHLDCDPKPFLSSLIIAANLGGASTMVGDFPNMIIASEAGVPFFQFITYMLPICVLLLLVMMLYLRLVRSALFDQVAPLQKNTLEQFDTYDAQDPDMPEPTVEQQQLYHDLRQNMPSARVNKKVLHRGLLILASVMVGFLVADALGVSTALIALVGGVIALLFGGCPAYRLVRKVSIGDVLFFAGLFIMVGAAEASGGLYYLSGLISRFSFGNLLVLSLLLMWIGAFATCLLNAGPAAAMFLPVVLSFKGAAPHNLYWWALSLGICAGSSGTLVGATSGSITATLANRFVRKELIEQIVRPSERPPSEARMTNMSFRGHAALGLPIMFIFLFISSVYITVIYQW